MMKGLEHLNQVEIIMKGLETDNQKTYTWRYLLSKVRFERNEMLKSSLTSHHFSKKPPRATDEKD